MTLPIFVDTNVVIYAVGRPHVFKDSCREILTLIAQYPSAFVTDADVLQELLHRYLRLQIWMEGRVVVRDFASLMRGRIEAVGPVDIERAASLADTHAGHGGRDLVHAAVMSRVGSDQIVSADRDFDRFPDVRRLEPTDLATWRTQVAT
jgi:hypothetical protein